MVVATLTVAGVTAMGFVVICSGARELGLGPVVGIAAVIIALWTLVIPYWVVQ
jgi:hypothetical protein